jgi:hypothetical protein
MSETAYPCGYQSGEAPEFGLSKREWFAGMALTGQFIVIHATMAAMLASLDNIETVEKIAGAFKEMADENKIVKSAYSLADAMLKESSK